MDNNTASGRSSSGSGRSGTGSEPDIELEEAGKPVGFILDVRFLAGFNGNSTNSLFYSGEKYALLRLLSQLTVPYGFTLISTYMTDFTNLHYPLCLLTLDY